MTTETKTGHTPGPWEWEHWPDDREGDGDSLAFLRAAIAKATGQDGGGS